MEKMRKRLKRKEKERIMIKGRKRCLEIGLDICG